MSSTDFDKYKKATGIEKERLKKKIIIDFVSNKNDIYKHIYNNNNLVFDSSISSSSVDNTYNIHHISTFHSSCSNIGTLDGMFSANITHIG